MVRLEYFSLYTFPRPHVFHMPILHTKQYIYSYSILPKHNHTNLSSPGSSKEWNEFVFKEVKVWQETLLVFLLHNYNHPVMVVRYEDLKKNTKYELRRMLDFMQVPYRQSQLDKIVNKGYSKYKRKKTLKEFDHYTLEQREYVRSVIKETADILLTEHGLLKVANVSIYLE